MIYTRVDLDFLREHTFRTAAEKLQVGGRNPSEQRSPSVHRSKQNMKLRKHDPLLNP